MMAFHHRKFLISEPNKKPKFSQKFATEDCYLCYVCPESCYVSPPPPEYPPPPPPAQFSECNSTKNDVPTVLIVMLCVLGVAFVVLSYLTVARYRRRRDSDSSRRNVMEENQIDHPIWYIRSVGLPETVIDGVASWAYRKGEGIIEGNECSVCLNEFDEGDMVRLLPKCSHAFHLHCIDTWLRSHKNCPVCRAPVLAADAGRARVRVDSPTDQPAGTDELPLDDNPSKHATDLERHLPLRRSLSMDLSNSSIYTVMSINRSFSFTATGKKNTTSSESNSNFT